MDFSGVKSHLYNVWYLTTNRQGYGGPLVLWGVESIQYNLSVLMLSYRITRYISDDDMTDLARFMQWCKTHTELDVYI